MKFYELTFWSGYTEEEINLSLFFKKKKNLLYFFTSLEGKRLQREYEYNHIYEHKTKD